MWIVQVALLRPYTLLVMALLILLATPLVLLKMSTDIFPEIDIPVISIVWNYAGLSTQEMGLRITAAVAAYRQTVLNAMEEVENGITGLSSLDRAATQADASVHSAPRTFDIASDRYK